MRKGLLAAMAIAAFSSLTTEPAPAGNFFATGHDADLHCSGGDQCNLFGRAIDFVRQGAPDPTKPILFLDNGTQTADAAGQAAARAANTIQGAGNPFNFVVINPSSAAFGTTALTTGLYSAILIASDSTCGGCDLGVAEIAGINARSADLKTFFNAGGGLAYMSGADRRDTYYASVPIPATGAAVSPPFTLTPAGIAFGLTSDGDANCCPTHNSFQLPGAGSPLTVLETDSAGLAETIIARGAVIGGGGGFEAPPTVPLPNGGPAGGTTGGPTTGVVPEPASLLLMISGLIGIGAWERKRRRA